MENRLERIEDGAGCRDAAVKKPPRGTKLTIGRRMLRDWRVYLMLVPVVLFYLVFCYYPMYGIVLAFKDFRPSQGIMGSEWLGFEHFRTLFTATPEFGRAIKNTVVISFLKLIFCFPAPIILALFLNEVSGRGFKKGVQTAVYFPNFISWVIFGNIVYQIFGVDGLINNVLGNMGIQPKTLCPIRQIFIRF